MLTGENQRSYHRSVPYSKNQSHAEFDLEDKANCYNSQYIQSQAEQPSTLKRKYSDILYDLNINDVKQKLEKVPKLLSLLKG